MAVKPKMIAEKVRAMPSLGASQLALEAAAKELRTAQRGYSAAADRMRAAEEGHTIAVTSLNAALWVVKSDTKVISLHAQ